MEPPRETSFIRTVANACWQGGCEGLVYGTIAGAAAVVTLATSVGLQNKSGMISESPGIDFELHAFQPGEPDGMPYSKISVLCFLIPAITLPVVYGAGGGINAVVTYLSPKTKQD